MTEQNPFEHVKQALTVGDETFHYYNLQAMKDARLEKLPFSIRVLLESAVRNCDNFNIKRKENLINLLQLLTWRIS